MRQWSGISRVVKVPRDTQFLAYPSVGGSRGYDIHTREMAVAGGGTGEAAPLPVHPAMVPSVLPNGFSYVFLPNQYLRLAIFLLCSDCKTLSCNPSLSGAPSIVWTQLCSPIA